MASNGEDARPAGGQRGIVTVFSTASAGASLNGRTLRQASFVGDDHLDPLLEATAQAVEESSVNAMVAARDMCGERGRCVKAIPYAKLAALLRRFGRYRLPR